MNRLTKQELFNNTYRHHILEDGPYGYNVEAEICVYHGKNGERCAVGISIPNEIYNPDWDSAMGGSIDHLYDEYSSIRDLFGPEARPFLIDLQKAHDDSCLLKKSAYKFQLQTLAIKYNLDIPTE